MKNRKFFKRDIDRLVELANSMRKPVVYVKENKIYVWNKGGVIVYFVNIKDSEDKILKNRIRRSYERSKI